MPEKYKADEWNIKEGDIYKTATKKQQDIWNRNIAKPKNKIDFTLCNNLYIREELKYVMYTIIKDEGKISTFSNNYNRFKTLCKYINETNKYNSLIEYENESYESYFAVKLKRETFIKDNDYINKNMKKEEHTRKNLSVTFFYRCIEILKNYRDRNLPLMDRDIWKEEQILFINPNNKFRNNLDFSSIKQESIKLTIKEFCRYELTVKKNTTVTNALIYLKNFTEWLYSYDSKIEYLRQLNRDIMEKFFLYLRVESGFSDYYANHCILQLKVFFESLQLLELDNIPEKTLIIPNDYAFKSKKESKYFTDEEARNITNVMKYMTKTDAKIVFCLKTLGCRISEVLNLKPTQIVKNDNGEYSLNIYQEKVNREYLKPIEKQIAAILFSEISKNKKRFGVEPEYVFLTDNNTTISYSSFIQRINKIFYKYKVKDKDGNLLRFQTHRFRATVATNLINSGYGAKETAKLLGHSNLSSLTHYIHIHDETVLKQLAPRLAKDDALIKNIELMGKSSSTTSILESTENEVGVPLCNGWCSKDVASLGTCKKANVCLSCGLFKPSIEYLNNYEMQLSNVLDTIEIAKANDMEVLLKKNLKLKEELENIIKIVKEKL